MLEIYKHLHIFICLWTMTVGFPVEYKEDSDNSINSWDERPADNRVYNPDAPAERIDKNKGYGRFNKPYPFREYNIWERLEQLRDNSRANMHWNEPNMVVPKPVQNSGLNVNQENQDQKEDEKTSFQLFNEASDNSPSLSDSAALNDNQLLQNEANFSPSSSMEPKQNNDFLMQKQPNMNSPETRIADATAKHEPRYNLEKDSFNEDPAPIQHNYQPWNERVDPVRSSVVSPHNDNMVVQKKPTSSSSASPLGNDEFIQQQQPQDDSSSHSPVPLVNNNVLQDKPNGSLTSSAAPPKIIQIALQNKANNSPNSDKTPPKNIQFALQNQPNNNSPSSSKDELQNINLGKANQQNSPDSSLSQVQNNGFALQNQFRESPSSSDSPVQDDYFALQQPKDKSPSPIHDNFEHFGFNENWEDKLPQKENNDRLSENEIKENDPQENSYLNNNIPINQDFDAPEDSGLKSQDEDRIFILRRLLSVGEAAKKPIDLNKIKKEVESAEIKEQHSEEIHDATVNETVSQNVTTQNPVAKNDTEVNSDGFEDMIDSNSTWKTEEANGTLGSLESTGIEEDMLNSKNDSVPSPNGYEDMVESDSNEDVGINGTELYEEGIGALEEMLNALNNSIETLLHDTELNETIENEEGVSGNVSIIHFNAMNESAKNESVPGNMSLILATAFNDSFENPGNSSGSFLNALNDSLTDEGSLGNAFNDSLEGEGAIAGNEIVEENNLGINANQSASLISNIIDQLLNEINEVEGGSGQALVKIFEDGKECNCIGKDECNCTNIDEDCSSSGEESGEEIVSGDNSGEGSGTESGSGEETGAGTSSGEADHVKNINGSGDGAMGSENETESESMEASGSGDEESVDMLREIDESGAVVPASGSGEGSTGSLGQQTVTQKGSWEGNGPGLVDMAGEIVNDTNSTALNNSESEEESGSGHGSMEEGSTGESLGEGSGEAENGELYASREAEGKKGEGEGKAETGEGNRKRRVLSMHEIMERIRKRIS